MTARLAPRSRTLGLGLALLVVFTPKEAWLSSAHAIQFLTPRFAYEHEELSRKGFVDQRDEDDYFAFKRRHSTQVFLAAIPRIEHLFAQAAARGIALAPLALRRFDDAVAAPPDSAEALRVLTARGPGRPVRLRLDGGPRAASADHLVVQPARPLTRAQAGWLWAQLPSLRFAVLAEDEAAIARVDEAALTRFRPGFGVTRTAGRFALWAGSTEEIRPEDEALFRAQAAALADELMPALERAFADPATAAALLEGDLSRLIPVEEKLGRPLGKDEAGPFNPWGPLLDDLGMRARAEAGRLRVLLLFTVRGRWGDGPGALQLTGVAPFLQRLVVPRAERDARIDAALAEAAASPARRGELLDELERLAKAPALRSVGGQRVIDALVRRALARGPDRDGMQAAALGSLRWIDAPERDRVYLTLIKERRHEPFMTVISQSFGERPDAVRVEALLGVLRDPAASSEARAWAKNGLGTAANHLARSGAADASSLKAKIDAALEE